MGSYHASHFAFLARALQESIKICVQIEREGFMCIQVMMPVNEGVDMGNHSGILEFKVSSRRPCTLEKADMSDERIGE
jgi:cell cycle checkpoint protein